MTDSNYFDCLVTKILRTCDEAYNNSAKKLLKNGNKTTDRNLLCNILIDQGLKLKSVKGAHYKEFFIILIVEMSRRQFF